MHGDSRVLCDAPVRLRTAINLATIAEVDYGSLPAGPTRFGVMGGILAAPDMHVSRLQFRPARELSTLQGREELNRLYLLVREFSTLFSHLFLVEKSAIEELSTSPMSSDLGPSTTYPEVAQDVTLSNAPNDDSLSVPNEGPSTTDPTGSGQYQQVVDGLLQNGITSVEDLLKDKLASLVHLFKDAEEFPSASLDEWLENHIRLIRQGDDVPSTGLNDQTQDQTTTSYDPLFDYFDMPDSQLAPINDMSKDWMVDESPSPREGDGENERDKRDQGQRGSFDLEPQQREQQLGNELMSCIKEVVPWKLQEIEASYRSMLQDLKSEVANITDILKGEVNRVKENIYCYLDEMRRTVNSFLNGVQNVRKRLPKAIFRLIDMCDGDLRRLFQKTDTITMDLGYIKKQLETQELSVAESFQKCASSIYNRWSPS